MKKWLIMMKPENLMKCENGTKTQTRRSNKRYEGIEAGDHLFFRSNYKTTYLTASGPYLATEKPRWENIQDISEEDSIAEGVQAGLCLDATEMFEMLWKSIYKKKDTWEENPRVLRIAFKKSPEKG